MKRLLLSCQAATELMEKKQRMKLSFSEKAQLFLHTAMCSACRKYEKQSAFLEQLFKAKEDTSAQPGIDLQTLELEKKILQQLKEKE